MTSITQKIFVGVMALALCFSFSFAVAEDEDDIRDEMAALEELLADLAAQLGATVDEDDDEDEATTQVDSRIPAGFSFDQNLKQGMSGQNVMYLQILLNADADTMLAASGAGSPGNETTNFGPITDTAVKKFQTKYASEVLTPIGLTTATGFVGTQTRAKLNAILASGEITAPTSDVLTMLNELADAVAALSARVDALDPAVVDGDEGVLTVAVSPDVYDAKVYANKSGVEIAEIEIEAEDSDLTIQRVNVTFGHVSMSNSNLMKVLDTVYLYHDGEEVASVGLTRDSLRDGVSTQIYVRFTGLNVKVDEDGKEKLTVVVDSEDFTSSETLSDATVEVLVLIDAIRALDSAGIYQYNTDTSASRNFSFVDDAAGVDVEISDDTPEEGVVTIKETTTTDDVVLAIFDITAEDGDVELTDISMEFHMDTATGGDASASIGNVVRRAKLYVDGTFIEEQATLTGTVVFDANYYLVEEDETAEVKVVVDLYSKDAASFDAEGHILVAELTQVEGVDAEETAISAWATSITGEKQHLYTGVPVFSYVDSGFDYTDDTSGTTQMQSGAEMFLLFDITAAERDIYISNTTDLDQNSSDAFAGLFLFDLGRTATWAAEGMFDFVSGTYDENVGPTAGSTSYFRIKKGNTARVEIIGDFKAYSTDTPLANFASSGTALISSFEEVVIDRLTWGVVNVGDDGLDSIIWTQTDFEFVVEDLKTERIRD